MERELGFEDVTIPHRMSEVASALRVSVKDATTAELEMRQLIQPLMEDAMKIESTVAGALRNFITRRDKALAVREETQAEREARDNEQRRIERGLLSRLAEMPGERVSFEERRRLIEAHGVSEEAVSELMNSIDGARETVDTMKAIQGEAATTVANLDAQIGLLEKQTAKNPRAFKNKLDKNSKLVELEGLRDQRAKALAKQEQLQKGIAAVEAEIKKAENKIPALLAEKDRIEALFANEPEIVSQTVTNLNKRIEKKEKTIAGVEAKLKEEQDAATRRSRKNDLSKYKIELKKLQDMRDAKRGIERTTLPALPPETEAVMPGTRLAAPVTGPVTRKAVQAGNIRTGEKVTTEGRKLSTQNKVRQAGTPRGYTPLQAQRLANKDVEAEQAMLRMTYVDDLKERAEARLEAAKEAKNEADITKFTGFIERLDKELARLEKIVGKRLVEPPELFTGDELGTTFAQAVFTPVSPTMSSSINAGKLLLHVS